MAKNIFYMTKKDFLELPHREFGENIGKFYSLVIIPTKRKHDSGYMCMEFAAVDENNEPICLLSGCSDVIHIDGMGGYGKWKWDSALPKLIKPKDWRIDCLPCGYLRLFADGEIETDEFAASSFCIYAVKED